MPSETASGVPPFRIISASAKEWWGLFRGAASTLCEGRLEFLAAHVAIVVLVRLIETRRCGRSAAAGRSGLLAFYAERSEGLAIELAGRVEALPVLEFAQRVMGARAPDPIDGPDIHA